MQTFYQFLFAEATPPPPPSGKQPGAGPTPGGPSAPPMGSPGPSGPPIGLGGGGPPIGGGGPPIGGGGPPSLSPPMGAGPEQGQNPNATVKVQKLNSKDVWEALEKSLQSFKPRHSKKNQI